MRNSETQPQVVRSFGIKQQDLSMAVPHVVKTYTDLTGSQLPNKWIFHYGRIQSELNQGREGLEVTLPTGRGLMTLSAKKQGEHVVFDLNAHREQKPENLHPHYQAMEEQFRSQVYVYLQELGIAEPVVF